MQLKEKRIYKEDIVGSKWYKFVSNNKDEINLIWKLDVEKTFESDPLAFFKKFCLKAMGIVCTLEQPKGTHPDEHKKLVKEHNAKDIYRKLSEDVINDARKHLGNKVFNTIIPRNVRLSEAPSHGLPAILYDRKCMGSEAYIELAKEFIKRVEVV